jgi:hypothetical protein
VRPSTPGDRFDELPHTRQGRHNSAAAATFELTDIVPPFANSHASRPGSFVVPSARPSSHTRRPTFMRRVSRNR